MSQARDDDDVAIPFPFEFIVEQITPVSAQSKDAKAREAWIKIVSDRERSALGIVRELYFYDERPIAATIYYFPEGRMQGDVDNIVKLILDGLKAVAYPDDSVVERCVVQKFEPKTGFAFDGPSPVLDSAIRSIKPCLYVRLDDDLAWRKGR